MRNFVKKTGSRALQVAERSKWAFFSATSSIGIAIFTIWIWSNYLSPSQLGELALWISVPSLLQGVFLQAINKAMIISHANFVGTEPKTIISVAKRIFFRRALLIACGMVAVSVFFIWKNLKISEFILITAGTFLLDCAREFKRATELVKLRQRSASLISILDSSAKALGLFIGVAFVSDVHHALVGNLLGTIFSSLLVLRYSDLRVAIEKNVDIDLSDIKNYITTLSLDILPGNLMIQLQEVGPRYLMAMTSTPHQTGIFVLAFGLIKRPFGLLRDFGPTFFLPEFVRSFEGRSESKVSEMRSNWVYFISLGVILGVTVCYFFSEVLVRNFLSEKYQEVTWIIAPLALVVGIGVIASVYDELLICLGLVLFVRKIFIIELVIAGVSFVFLSSSFGAIGGVAAIGVGAIIHLGIVYSRSKYSTAELINERLGR